MPIFSQLSGGRYIPAAISKHIITYNMIITLNETSSEGNDGHDYTSCERVENLIA